MALPAPMYTWPPEIDPPPRGEDLPYSDGDKLESQRHADQIEILVTSLREHWADRQDAYVAREMFFYFSTAQAKNNDFRGPDFFAVTGVERKERKSWVVWEENGRVPDVIIEVTSASTIREDHIRKKQVYASIGVPEYFIYDPFTHDLDGFRLQGGQYQPIKPGRDGRFRSIKLGLFLGLHPADYWGYSGPWLRWFQGSKLVEVPLERAARAETQRQQAEEQLQQAEEQLQQLQEKERMVVGEAARLRELLRQAGIDPDQG